MDGLICGMLALVLLAGWALLVVETKIEDLVERNHCITVWYGLASTISFFGAYKFRDHVIALAICLTSGAIMAAATALRASRLRNG